MTSSSSTTSRSTVEALPSLTQTWRDGLWPQRAIGAAVFLSTLGLLLLAWSLRPDPTGTGTHEQLGMAPCGFKLATGLPCITCGMTTSFAHAAEGNLLTSFTTQPGGLLLAILTAMACWVGLWAMISGMSLAALGQFLANRRVIIALAVTLVAAWGYTLVNAILSMP